MKNRRLKRWVTYLLVVVAICSILVAISDFKSLSEQIVYSTIGTSLFVILAKIVQKYGALE